MSIKIGSVHTSSKGPIMHTAGAPVTVSVHVSAAGIELVTLPCVLTEKEAEELCSLILRAIRAARDFTCAELVDRKGGT